MIEHHRKGGNTQGTLTTIEIHEMWTFISKGNDVSSFYVYLYYQTRLQINFYYDYTVQYHKV